jgi:hypothetical protein
MTSNTTMHAITGTGVSGALLGVWTDPRAQKLRVPPFAHWITDNSREVSARRYRHT